MNFKALFNTLSPSVLVATCALVSPVYAQSIDLSPTPTNPAPESLTPTIAQPTTDNLTTRRVLEACKQNRAETLPNPFVDVSPNHWAYKAVLSMHYCGAFREATPQSLIDRLSNETPTKPNQPVQ